MNTPVLGQEKHDSVNGSAPRLLAVHGRFLPPPPVPQQQAEQQFTPRNIDVFHVFQRHAVLHFVYNRVLAK